MDCKEFRERLDPYVDGELSAASAHEAREHSKGCASCAKAEAGLLHLRSSLKRVVERHRPPPGLEREVLRSLRARGRATRLPPGGALVESRRAGMHVWRAKVIVPVPLFALLLLSLVAVVGWLVFVHAPARGEEVSTKRPAPVASPAPPAEALGGFNFSGYYRGERASIRVVRRAGLGGPGQ